MPDILLINPNANRATTDMMVAIAAAEASPGYAVVGATAEHGPPMIVNETELNAAALEVEHAWHAWRSAGRTCAGVIVSAFGDPGLARLRAIAAVPVVGICEASMLEAGHGGRRFGVATVTPDLVDAIDGRAVAYGLASIYTGIRLTEGEPRALAADPQALQAALARAVARCIDDDGAQAVIIGGGPLGQAAVGLSSGFRVPVIAPIPAAVRRLEMLIESLGAHASAMPMNS